MPTELAAAFFTTAGAVILAGASYWFTKQREREAELRKEKLEHYKELVSSLSGIIAGEDSPDGHRSYAKACNSLILVAPLSVLQALQDFRNANLIGHPTPSRELHDRLLSKLLFEVRKDLGVLPSDSAETFKIGLWTSGYPTNGP